VTRVSLPSREPAFGDERQATPRRLRVGVLGAGPIAQAAHFEALGKARNCELHAICDRATDLLEQMAAVHRPRRTFEDYDAMLVDPDLDAVVVAIADQFHVDAAVQALDAGKHVLVEKPLGVTVAEGVRLRDRVADTGLVLQVGTMRRFDAGIAFARDFIREELGGLVGLKAWYCDSAYRYTMTDALQPVIRQSPHAHRPPGNPKADRRRYLMLGHGSHLVDMARFLAGDITAVDARLVERGGILSWFAACEFAGGANGHLDLTVAVSMDWHEGFQVYGERGSVLGRMFQPWYLRTSEVEAFSDRTGSYHRPLGPDGHFWRRQAEGFAATILDGVPQHGAAAQDGLAALRVIEAIERSVDGGGRVAVEAA
jgi:predicted dehydrogenase